MLQLITAGESHGRYMTAILEGMPSGLTIDEKLLTVELARRQGGYGRGGRQRIEKDSVTLTSGVYKGKTTGAPIAFLLQNKDETIHQLPPLLRPRPGHADLAGALKYGTGIREILERASARETVMRVAAGSVARMLLKAVKMEVVGHVVQIGAAKLTETVNSSQITKRRKGSPVNCISRAVERAMMAEINNVMKRKDTIGGKFEVRATNVPIGLGSHVHWARKLDGQLAQGLMSMQSVKAVEVGLGTAAAGIPGSEAHDEIFYDRLRGYYHRTNRAGGFTGGMTNGQDIVVTATMKPIATLRRELRSVNMKTKRAEKADFERSDVCAVPAGSVIGEAIVAYHIAGALIEKFGGDSVDEFACNVKCYRRTLG
jgi:chorismate synthase